MRGEVKSKGSQFKVRFSGLLFQCVPKRIPRKNRWPISSSTHNNDFAHSVMDMPCDSERARAVEATSILAMMMMMMIPE